MKIAICDDEQVYVDLLREKTEKLIKGRFNEKLTIVGYKKASELIAAYPLELFDVVFLDINMPEMDGRKTAKHLRSLSMNLILVYFSSYDEFVFDSFDASPIGYIRKTKLDEELEKVCYRIIRKYKEYNSLIKIETKEGESCLCPSKVWYIESKRRYLIVSYGDDKFEKIKYPIKKMSELLENKGFIRIHKSFLLNYRFIYIFEDKEVLLSDLKTRLPLTRNRIKEIRSIYFDWIGGRK